MQSRNGHNDDDFERDDPVDEPIPGEPEQPMVPPGHVVITDSRGNQIIVPDGPHPGGRPTKRTPQNRQRIIAAVRLGSTFKLAAAYGGMSYDNFQEWRRDDPTFAEEIEHAVGVAAAQWLNVIENATKIDWRAAAWKLQHRFPTEYGRNVQELSGPAGGPIQVREITVRVPESMALDDDNSFDEGPPNGLPSGDE